MTKPTDDARDDLREVLAEAVSRHLDEQWIARSGDAEAIAAALLPVVTAWAEAQARARAAEELRAEAADWEAAERVGSFARRLRDRAAALTTGDPA